MTSRSKSQSFQEDIPPERYEQIIRVDANGLLKTIKELESKLSEHQRQDKMPAWAVALEARIMRLEAGYVPSSPENKKRSESPMRNSSLIDENEKKDDDDDDAIIAEGKDSTTTLFSSAATAGGGGGAKIEMRSLQDLVLEDRVINKMRTEVDNKVHASEVNLEAKLSSFHLEMERLHKLLQIRPTTSEMQQVIVSVHEIEKEVKASMDVMKEEAIASLRDRISEEMLSIVSEIKSAKSSNDSSIELISQTVHDYSIEMTELRQGIQSSVIDLTSQITSCHEENKSLEDKLTIVCAQLGNEVKAMEASIADVRIEVRTDVESLATYKQKNAEMISTLQSQINGNYEILEKKLDSQLEKIQEMVGLMDVLKETIERFETSYESDISSLNAQQSSINTSLNEQQYKVAELKSIVEELLSLDIPSKIIKHDEMFNTIKYDLIDLHNIVDTALQSDIKTINMKISQVQEQCNISIPQLCTDLSIRIDKLNHHLNNTDLTINNTRDQLNLAEATIAELLPLKDRMSLAEEISNELRKDINSMKETLSNTIDTTDDLLRRMEEAEEAIDHMDDAIVTRMNQVRDALMDTLLEKQAETNKQVRNVRENLEVMSMAGDANTVSSGGGGGGGQHPMKRHSRNNSIVFANTPQAESEFIDDAPQSSVRFDEDGDQGRMNLSPPSSHFKRPSMTGQVVAGQQAPMSLTRQLSGFLQDGSQQNSPVGSAGGVGMMRRQASMQGTAPGGMAGMLNRQRSIRNSRGTTLGGHPLGAHTSMMQSPRMQSPFMSSPMMQRQMSGQQQGHMQQYQQQMPIMQQAQYPMSAPMQMTGMPTLPASRGSQPGILRQPSSRLSPRPLDGSGSQESFAPPPQGISPPNEGGGRLSKRYEGPMRADIDSISMSATQTGGQSDNDSVFAPQDDALSVGFPEGGVDQNMVLQAAGIPPGYNAMVPAGGPESNAITQQMSGIMGMPAADPMEYVHFQQVQFLSDLCLNFEELSVKRKRVAAVPPMICESIAEITMELAEFMARMADFEMVEGLLVSMHGVVAVQDAQYDENFIIQRREQKVEEFIDYVTGQIVNTSNQPQPGIVRMDARTLFVSLIKKALDLFMSKHNQVLVAGNSRLGRIKIPSCVACDRPLVEKVRLDQAVSRGGGSVGGGPSTDFGGPGMLRHLTANYPHPPGSLNGGSSSLMRWGDSQELDGDQFPTGNFQGASTTASNKRPNMHGHSLAPLEKKSNTKMKKSASSAGPMSASSFSEKSDGTMLSLSAKLPTVS